MFLIFLMKLIFVLVLLWSNFFWLTLFNKISLFNFWYLLVQLNSFLSIMLRCNEMWCEVLALCWPYTDWGLDWPDWLWWRGGGGEGGPAVPGRLYWNVIRSVWSSPGYSTTSRKLCQISDRAKFNRNQRWILWSPHRKMKCPEKTDKNQTHQFPHRVARLRYQNILPRS